MELKYNICVITSILVALFLHQFGESTTLVVDGVSEWKNPTVQVGDSISKFKLCFYFLFTLTILFKNLLFKILNTLFQDIQELSFTFFFNCYFSKK